MAGRDLTTQMQTALAAQTVRPVLIARFDILSDPLTAWTGPGTFAPTGTGDTALDNQIFVNAAPFIEMSEITEDQRIGGAVTLGVSGHDLDEDLLRQVLRDKRQWRGRRAWLWMGLLASDEHVVITNPMRVKTGVMTAMNVERDAESSLVQVIIDKDLGRAQSAPFRWIDHPRLFPNDTWSTFIVDLFNQPGGITDRPLGGGYGGGGGYRGYGPGGRFIRPH